MQITIIGRGSIKTVLYCLLYTTLSTVQYTDYPTQHAATFLIQGDSVTRFSTGYFSWVSFLSVPLSPSWFFFVNLPRYSSNVIDSLVSTALVTENSPSSRLLLRNTGEKFFASFKIREENSTCVNYTIEHALQASRKPMRACLFVGVDTPQ